MIEKMSRAVLRRANNGGFRLPSIRDWKGGHRGLDEGAIFASRVVGVLASTITSAVTARFLGPAGRGEYFFGLIVASLIAQFANYGLSSANFYYSARSPDKIRAILVMSLIISLVICALLTGWYVFIVRYDYASSWKTEFSPSLIYGIAVCSLLSATVSPCLIGMKRYFAMAVSQASVALLGVALILTVAMLSPTVENFGIAVLIATGALPLLCIFLLWPRARIAGETPRGENTFARDWLVYGFRAFPPLVLAYLAGRGTIFAAHSAIDAGTFGILSVAYQVFEATLAAPQSIAMVMFPRLITGGDISAARLRRECGRIGLISILIALGIVIFFKPILLLMFGHKYDGAYGILLWYLPGFIAYSIVSICIQFFATFHFPWTSNLAWATGAAAGVTASFYGAAWFGARGAAAGASLGWMVAAVGLFLVGIHEIGKRRRLMEPSVGAVAHGR